MNYGIYTIDIWSISCFEPVSDTLSNFHGWGCMTYVLGGNFHKTRVKLYK